MDEEKFNKLSGRGTRKFNDLVGFAGCMCADCGHVLPHRVSKENPITQLKPIEGDEIREFGLWIEVIACPRCKPNSPNED